MDLEKKFGLTENSWTANSAASGYNLGRSQTQKEASRLELILSTYNATQERMQEESCSIVPEDLVVQLKYKASNRSDGTAQQGRDFSLEDRMRYDSVLFAADLESWIQFLQSSVLEEAVAKCKELLQAINLKRKSQSTRPSATAEKRRRVDERAAACGKRVEEDSRGKKRLADGNSQQPPRKKSPPALTIKPCLVEETLSTP